MFYEFVLGGIGAIIGALIIYTVRYYYGRWELKRLHTEIEAIYEILDMYDNRIRRFEGKEGNKIARDNKEEAQAQLTQALPQALAVWNNKELSEDQKKAQIAQLAQQYPEALNAILKKFKLF